MPTIRVLPKQCTYCKVPPVEMELDEKKFRAWRNGMLIQDAFPELNVDERELLITGIHSKCWDEMFKDEDTEFDYSAQFDED